MASTRPAVHASLLALALFALPLPGKTTTWVRTGFDGAGLKQYVGQPFLEQDKAHKIVTMWIKFVPANIEDRDLFRQVSGQPELAYTVDRIGYDCVQGSKYNHEWAEYAAKGRLLRRSTVMVQGEERPSMTPVEERDEAMVYACKKAFKMDVSKLWKPASSAKGSKK